MPSTTTQRKLATQFISVTNATRENAQMYLKNANYNLDAAVNLYFSGADNDHAATPVLDAKSREVQLNQMFDSFRSPEEDADKDTMGVTSISQYANALGVDMLNFEYLVLCEVLQPQVLGQISRKEFVDGWKNQVDDTNHSIIPPTVEAQRTFIRRRIQQIPRNYTLFRNVYRQAFFSGREPQQKAIPKEIALAFWELLFDEGVWPWRTNKVDWRGVWKEYITEKWMRSVNKDMWNQTLEFARRTMEDDSLGFWNEDQAWPGVIDDFVVWCREQGFVESGKKEGEGMEVD